MLDMSRELHTSLRYLSVPSDGLRELRERS